MDDLKQITTLAKQQAKLERALKAMKERQKVKEDALRRVSEVDLPEAMSAAGVSEITLKGGRRVEIKKKYYASLPKEDPDKRERVLSWIRDNGHGGIIKRIVSLEFGKGQDSEASKATLKLSKAYPEIPLIDKADIHHSTYKAFMKRRHEDGDDVPFEDFGVHIVDVSTIVSK